MYIFSVDLTHVRSCMCDLRSLCMYLHNYYVYLILKYDQYNWIWNYNKIYVWCVWRDISEESPSAPVLRPKLRLLRRIRRELVTVESVASVYLQQKQELLPREREREGGGETERERKREATYHRIRGIALLTHNPRNAGVHGDSRLRAPIYVSFGSIAILPIDISVLIFNLTSKSFM